MIDYNTKDLWNYYRLNGGTLAYDVYKTIIVSFNKKLSHRIIRGYVFKIPHGLGLLKVIERERKIAFKENGNIIGNVNWGESKKQKQILVDEGRLPYEAFKDEAGEIIGDNGGEKYLVYFTDDYYYAWVRVVETLTHNSHKYKFKPSWQNSRDLIAFVKKSPEVDLLYKKRKEVLSFREKNFLNKVLENAEH